ncbi:MAG: DUF2865 domain-containing protein [Phyllobacterium sp.]
MTVFSTGLAGVRAEPAACYKLRQQLASSSQERRSGSPNAAVQRLKISLQHTRVKARQAGCGGVLFSRGDPVQCARFDREVAKISLGIERLGKGDTPGRSRQRIVAALKANGCAERPRRFLDVLFGRPDPDARSARRDKAREVQEPAKGGQKPQPRRSPGASDTLASTYEGAAPQFSTPIKKGYRTLCVRTCDGYYFPISFSTKRKYFTRDQNACSAMCPAGRAQLYFHAVPEQESSDMISVVGKTPYADLPNAFNYRTLGLRAVPGCSCHGSYLGDGEAGTDGVESEELSVEAPATIEPVRAMADNTGAMDLQNEKAPMAKAVELPHPGAANLAGGEVRPLASEPMRQNVRIVGPRFFPKKSETIDLKSVPPRQPEEGTARYTAETIIKTITSDVWSRIE